MQTIPIRSRRRVKTCFCIVALWGGAALGALAGCGEKPTAEAPKTIEQERERHQEMSKREAGGQD